MAFQLASLYSFGSSHIMNIVKILLDYYCTISLAWLKTGSESFNRMARMTALTLKPNQPSGT